MEASKPPPQTWGFPEAKIGLYPSPKYGVLFQNGGFVATFAELKLPLQLSSLLCKTDFLVFTIMRASPFFFFFFFKSPNLGLPDDSCCPKIESIARDFCLHLDSLDIWDVHNITSTLEQFKSIPPKYLSSQIFPKLKSLQSPSSKYLKFQYVQLPILVEAAVPGSPPTAT